MDELVADGIDDGHFVLAFGYFSLKKGVHDVAFSDGDQCRKVEQLFDVLRLVSF